MAKAISILAKIVMARKISTIAMSVYSLTLPTLSLLLNFAQLGIPTTISKLIAKRKYPTFKIMQVSFFILLLIDLIVGIIYLFFVPYIANSYLKNPLTTLTLYGIVLLIPLISTTSLLKGYFIGIDKVSVTSKCQISEEIVRLLFIVIFIDFISKNNVSILSFFAMFSSIVGEIASLIHMLLIINIKKKKVIKRISIDNNYNTQIANKIIKLSILNTSTRLIGSLIYFFEPIIYTHLMLKQNISSNELTLKYGIINSYVFPLLLLPSFFSNCISLFLLPKLSKYIENKNYNKSFKTFVFSSIVSVFIGFFCLTFIYIFPEFFTKLLYGEVIGIEYIKKYSFLLVVYFLQPIIHVALVAFDKEKSLLFESIICNSIKVVLFFILIPNFHIDGMVIAILASIYLSIIIHIISIIKSFYFLKTNDNLSST